MDEEIGGVWLNERLVILNDGTRLPILRTLDADREDCTDIDDIAFVIAGDEEHGLLEIEVEKPETVH